MKPVCITSRATRRRKDESGFFTIWTLGLCVSVLFLGGIIFDVWHAFSDRRELAAIVDAAAVAGANQVDLEVFRTTGEVQLNEQNARAAVAGYVATSAQTSDLTITSTNVEMQQNAVAVTSTAETDLFFAALFIQDTKLPVTVTGIADPRTAQ